MVNPNNTDTGQKVLSETSFICDSGNIGLSYIPDCTGTRKHTDMCIMSTGAYILYDIMYYTYPAWYTGVIDEFSSLVLKQNNYVLSELCARVRYTIQDTLISSN